MKMEGQLVYLCQGQECIGEIQYIEARTEMGYGLKASSKVAGTKCRPGCKMGMQGAKDK